MCSNQILILVATEQGAALCVNRDGCSELVARFPVATNDEQADAGTNVVSLAAVRSPLRALANDVMADLRERAASGDYEGIVIAASRAMIKELRMTMDRAVFDLVITEFVESPQFMPELPSLTQDVAPRRNLARSAV